MFISEFDMMMTTTKKNLNFWAVALISCVRVDKSLVRQPSTTEYLPGMLHAASPAGLLPQFPSWSLVCLGPSSLYSHNLGLQDQQQAGLLGGSAYLLPWDVTVRLEHHRYCVNSVMCCGWCSKVLLKILYKSNFGPHVTTYTNNSCEGLYFFSIYFMFLRKESRHMRSVCCLSLCWCLPSHFIFCMS
jgi:hypothetical protein